MNETLKSTTYCGSPETEPSVSIGEFVARYQNGALTESVVGLNHQPKTREIGQRSLVAAEVLLEKSNEALTERLERRRQLFEEDPRIVGQEFALRLTKEFYKDVENGTANFSAYFILCPELHHGSDAAQVHALSHKYFLEHFDADLQTLDEIETDELGIEAISIIDDTALLCETTRYPSDDNSIGKIQSVKYFTEKIPY